MHNVKIILSNLADANARLWRRSKILWLFGWIFLVCACCGSILTLVPTPKSSTTLSPTRTIIEETATAQVYQDRGATLAANANATKTLPPSPIPTETSSILARLPTSPVPDATDTPSVITAIATVDLIVREGPGTAYSQIAKLKQGERVTLLGISTDKNWYQHTKGWSAAKYLQVSGDTSILQTVLVSAPATQASRSIPTIVIPPTAIPNRVTATPTYAGIRIGAVCKDGSTTGVTGRGACSGHGGVNYWLYR